MSVFGNVGAAQAAENVSKLVDLYEDLTVPVYQVNSQFIFTKNPKYFFPPSLSHVLSPLGLHRTPYFKGKKYIFVARSRERWSGRRRYGGSGGGGRKVSQNFESNCFSYLKTHRPYSSPSLRKEQKKREACCYLVGRNNCIPPPKYL